MIHGYERDEADVLFARRLFRAVPIESRFTWADLARGLPFAERFAGELEARYDIVLFLGVYHHLALEMEGRALGALVDDLLGRSGKFFAVRTKGVDEVEGHALAAGFERVHAHPGREEIGPLRIYRRTSEGASQR